MISTVFPHFGPFSGGRDPQFADKYSMDIRTFLNRNSKRKLSNERSPQLQGDETACFGETCRGREVTMTC